MIKRKPPQPAEESITSGKTAKKEGFQL